jgi:hypothetical protein
MTETQLQKPKISTQYSKKKDGSGITGVLTAISVAKSRHTTETSTAHKSVFFTAGESSLYSQVDTDLLLHRFVPLFAESITDSSLKGRYCIIWGPEYQKNGVSGMLRRVRLVRIDVSEELSASETSVLTRRTRRNITEDTILHSHRRKNLKSSRACQKSKICYVN